MGKPFYPSTTRARGPLVIPAPPLLATTGYADADLWHSPLLGECPLDSRPKFSYTYQLSQLLLGEAMVIRPLGLGWDSSSRDIVNPRLGQGFTVNFYLPTVSWS
jgi:hypothetical protein